jgi:hypothetical protein
VEKKKKERKLSISSRELTRVSNTPQQIYQTGHKLIKEACGVTPRRVDRPT